MTHPPEPTADQCTNNERLSDFEGLHTFACWYPQMGGYVAKCVVVLESTKKEDNCFGAYIWHDGSFPFNEYDGSPVYIHHCSAEQFIDFGNEVLEMMKQ